MRVVIQLSKLNEWLKEDEPSTEKSYLIALAMIMFFMHNNNTRSY